MKIRGLNALALQHKDFPHQRVYNMLEDIPSPGISFLWSTFGTAKAPIRDFLKRFPTGTMQVYLTNEVARRKIMYRGELGRGWNVRKYNRLLERSALRAQLTVRNRVRQILGTIQPHRTTQRIILCLGLEDQFTNDAVRNLIKIVRKDWPYEISRNPVDIRQTQLMFGRQRVDYVELHSCKPITAGRGMWSNDGCDIDYGQHRHLDNSVRASSLLDTFRGNTAAPGKVWLWFAEWQGLAVNNSRDAPKPRARDIRVSPESLRVARRILKAV